MTLLNHKEVAERFRVSARTVYRWRKLGLLARRLGRTTRYHIDDVEAFLRNNSTSGGAANPPPTP